VLPDLLLSDAAPSSSPLEAEVFLPLLEAAVFLPLLEAVPYPLPLGAAALQLE